MATHRFVIEGQPYVVTVGPRRGNTVQVTVNGRAYTVELTAPNPTSPRALVAGAESPPPATVSRAVPRPSPTAAVRDTGPPSPAAPTVGRSSRRAPTTPPPVTTAGTVRAPIAGVVLRVAVEIGQAVQEGTIVVVLEAMKMENEIVAPVAGVVEKILVSAQQRVRPGEILVTIGGESIVYSQ